MFHLNSFVNEIKDIGRQMAEKINEPLTRNVSTFNRPMKTRYQFSTTDTKEMLR